MTPEQLRARYQSPVETFEASDGSQWSLCPADARDGLEIFARLKTIATAEGIPAPGSLTDDPEVMDCYELLLRKTLCDDEGRRVFDTDDAVAALRCLPIGIYVEVGVACMTCNKLIGDDDAKKNLPATATA